MWSRLLGALCLFSAILLSSQQNQDSVYVQFDKNNGELLELEEWNDNSATAMFKKNTAAVASSWCSNTTKRLGECGLNSLDDPFGSGDVMTTEPESWNGDIRFKVWISLDSNKDAMEDVTVVPEEALVQILIEASDDYATELAEDMDYDITLRFIDDTKVGEDQDQSLNYIMIAVSILILLAACLLALVMKCKEDLEFKKQNEAAEAGNAPGMPNDGGEDVTLTTMKPLAEDDSKEASEAQPMI